MWLSNDCLFWKTFAQTLHFSCSFMVHYYCRGRPAPGILPAASLMLSSLLEIVLKHWSALQGFHKLEDTARYAGLILDPAEGFGPCFFCPSGKKRELIMLFWPIFGNSWCPVVTLVTFGSILCNFERNPKKTKKSKRF